MGKMWSEFSLMGLKKTSENSLSVKLKHKTKNEIKNTGILLQILWCDQYSTTSSPKR